MNINNSSNKYLEETKLLDYSNDKIQILISSKGWNKLDDFHKIKEIYEYVQNDIIFGYNCSDLRPASKVLQDGYGQCNTKGTLFMTLLRAVGIPCRVHGFYVRKELQKGAMSELIYKQAPEQVFHSWVEVLYESTWYELEGIILDKRYLYSLIKNEKSCRGSFCGFGVGVDNIQNIEIDWNKNNTYIQSKAITKDVGVFSSPDELYHKYGQKLSFIKNCMYRLYGRHSMNRNVNKIRNAK